jgi:chemotaxis-related protein WspD
MINDCWNQIGVVGDRSCPELKTYIHCRNCPVYAIAGRSLLEREPPPGYLEEWTHLLSQEKGAGEIQQVAPIGTISIGIFRLSGEWLALPAHLLKEVTQSNPIHTLPHRSNNILLGLVNIRGEIQMCVSLSELLGLEAVHANGNSKVSGPHIYGRMIVVEKEDNRWVFPVDEIYGIHRIHPNDLTNVPSTLAKVPETYTKGVINWQSRSVSFLDDELLFYTLSKKVL